jgi:hypothetical protein
LFTKKSKRRCWRGRWTWRAQPQGSSHGDTGGLEITAIPGREDARDAMVGRRLAELGQGAKVGTSSLRRSAQLRRLRPDLVVESVRGNVDTRLRKLDEGQVRRNRNWPRLD